MQTALVSRNGLYQEGPLRQHGQTGEIQHIAVNVAEQAKAYLVQAAVPGFPPENVEVRLEGKTLMLVARPVGEEPPLTRSVLLPEYVDTERAQAELSHGLLMVRLPKQRVKQPHMRRIRVHTAHQKRSWSPRSLTHIIGKAVSQMAQMVQQIQRPGFIRL
jgi:HSP20 family molecular chaperone IbpA